MTTVVTTDLPWRAVDYAAVTKARGEACDELLAGAERWLGPIPTSAPTTWVQHRIYETAVRALLTVKGALMLGRHGLWAQTYMLGRPLLEDAIVAHWLVSHPDPATLETRYVEHLDAVREGDYESQVDLGIQVDAETAAWRSGMDTEYLERVAKRFWGGRRHWTTKTLDELADGVAARGLPGRRDGADRAKFLHAISTRLLLHMNLGVHHSNASGQHWYSPPAELLPDALRAIYLSFELLVRLTLEDFAPERLGELDAVRDRGLPAFVE